MNRRAFTAGLAAFAPLTAITTGTARNEVKHYPEVVLRKYLNDVWIDHNLSAIDGLFDLDSPYLADIDLTLEHHLTLSTIDNERPLRIIHVVSNENVAMAIGAIRSITGDTSDMLVYIRVGPSGLITEFSLMANLDSE